MITPADLWNSSVRVESGGNPNAVGKAGEIGLVQIKPSLAAEYGVPKEALYHPAVQWMLYNRIMGKYLARYGGDPVKAVAAWNAGPGAVDSGQIPLTTQGYLRNFFGGAPAMLTRPPRPMPAAAPEEEEQPEELATTTDEPPAAAPRPPRAEPPPEDQLPALSDIVQARKARLAENARRVAELLNG